MSRRLSMSIAWDPRRAAELLEEARGAEDAGVDTLWMNEGFSHDAFTGLSLLA